MKKTTFISITLTLVFAVFVYAQWMPYFQYSENQTLSLASYLAFPTNHVDTTEYISALVEGYNINTILGSGILLPLAAIALTILLWHFRDNIVVMSASGAWGIWGLIAYSTNPALRLGSSTRLLFISLFAVAFILSIVYIFGVSKEGIKKVMERISTHQQKYDHVTTS